MGRLEISGGIPLKGKVEISGAKNEALKVIALAVLVQSEFQIENVPNISDIRAQLELLRALGGKYALSSNRLTIDGTGVSQINIDPVLSKELRASIVYLGPLLARFGEVNFPFPGGCAIGRRSIDTHLKAFADLGGVVKKEEKSFSVKFKKFKSKKITLNEASVTATENALMFLSHFEDDFILANCAIEPEILALVKILNDAGAKIKLISKRVFKIRGSSVLEIKKVKMIPDRIEAFSYLIGFLVTGGEGKIVNFPSEYMKKPLEVLKKTGANFKIGKDYVDVFKTEKFKPFKISTAVYPGFATDMQSPMSLIAALADGESYINETMFENRLGYILQLEKMGLKAKLLNKHEVRIKGSVKLRAANIEALDLRSGITLVLGALQANGTSKILRGEIIDRGYERLREKLTTLGARIERYD